MDDNKAMSELYSVLKPGGRAILQVPLPGAVNQRKGCDLLIRAFVDASLGNDARLLLLGKQGKAIQKLLKTDFVESVKTGRIVFINRFAKQLELIACLRLRIWLQSRIQFILDHLAFLFEQLKPTNVSLPQSGWVTKNFSWGESCDVKNREMFASKLAACLDKPNSATHCIEQKRFLEFHDLENHLAHWLNLICHEYGISTNRNPINFLSRLKTK